MVNNLDSLWVTRSSSQHSTLLLRHKSTRRSRAWRHSNKASSGLERVCANQSVQTEKRGRPVGQRGRAWWASEPGSAVPALAFPGSSSACQASSQEPLLFSLLPGQLHPQLTHSLFHQHTRTTRATILYSASLLQPPFLFLSSSHYLVVMHLLSMSSARM